MAKRVSTSAKVRDTESSTAPSLQRKLGLASGLALYSNLQLGEYESLVGMLPADSRWCESLKEADIIHFFINTNQDLLDSLQLCEAEMHDKASIWISWYKKSSKQPTELTEDRIRDSALEGTLVDTKVCAIDDHWSGLKLVRRVHLRSKR